MSHISKFAFVSALILSTLACGVLSNPLSGAQNLASTAEAMATSMPIQTLQALPSAMPDVTGMLNPVGQPTPIWNGIPVMAQATAGQEFSKTSYSYKAKVSETDVQNFYNNEMKALGWTSPFSATGGSQGGVMLFTKDSNILSITITSNNGETVVILFLQ